MFYRLLLFFVYCAQFTQASHLAYTWIGEYVTDAQETFVSVAMNGNGTSLLACNTLEDSGTGIQALYYSYSSSTPEYLVESDSSPVNGDTYGCTGIGSNKIGSIMYATTSTGPIYSSTDRGMTWGKVSEYPARAGSQIAFAVNSSGQQIASCISSSGVFMSYNYGRNWTNSFVGSVDLSCQAISASYSGQYIGIVAGDFVYISNDYGKLWSFPSFSANTGSTDWISITFSGNGEYACASGRKSDDLTDLLMYCSHDYGVTWNATSAPSVFNGIAYDETGANLFAISTEIYWSTNHGVTWTSSYNPNNDQMSVLTVGNTMIAVSSDASTVIVTGEGGILYGITTTVSDDFHDDDDDSSSNSSGGGLSLGELIGIIVGGIILVACLIGIAIGVLCFGLCVQKVPGVTPPLATTEQL